MRTVPDVAPVYIIRDDIFCPMDPEYIKSNWALIIAAALGVLIALIFVIHLFRQSAAGQLRATLRALAKARKDEAKATKSAENAERVARRLHDKADRAKPRHLQEAKDALGDARALAKIANDKVLIAENHVRKVIHEEYPPVKQQALRDKYLPAQKRDKIPFTF